MSSSSLLVAPTSKQRCRRRRRHHQHHVHRRRRFLPACTSNARSFCLGDCSSFSLPCRVSARGACESFFFKRLRKVKKHRRFERLVDEKKSKCPLDRPLSSSAPFSLSPLTSAQLPMQRGLQRKQQQEPAPLRCLQTRETLTRERARERRCFEE